MALRLLGAKRISIDTSFKRLHGWQEFEIEAWDSEHMRCKSFMQTSASCTEELSAVTGARAFTTSQSAQAHLILFQRIFQIGEDDTGVPVSFHHIHGTGYESVVADGHMGQGLGNVCSSCLLSQCSLLNTQALGCSALNSVRITPQSVVMNKTVSFVT
jgi:hypothetical protein